MVAFAGRKYAARSIPAFVANSTYTVTSFTLVRTHNFRPWFFINASFIDYWAKQISMWVLESQKGRLQNLYWKRDGCASCAGKSNFVCLNKQDCAIKTSDCKNRGGSVDCSLGIQLAFSGTDKHLTVLNSSYEVENLTVGIQIFGIRLPANRTNSFNTYDMQNADDLYYLQLEWCFKFVVS